MIKGNGTDVGNIDFELQAERGVKSLCFTMFRSFKEFILPTCDSFPLIMSQILDCWEHKSVKYMALTHDKRVILMNYQYVSYALLSLVGSMHLAGLCSKQSNTTNNQNLI